MTSCRSVESACATQQNMASCVRRTRRRDILLRGGGRDEGTKGGQGDLVELDATLQGRCGMWGSGRGRRVGPR